MRISLIALALLLPSAAYSQRLEPAGMQVPPSTFVPASPDTARKPVSYDLPVRVLLGVGSAFGGAFAGALTGMVFPHAPCSCDDPGLENALVGAMIGSIVAPAIISAAPAMASQCSYSKRIGVAMLGGLAGAALGGGIGASVPNGGVVFGYVGGAGLGAALGSGLCK